MMGKVVLGKGLKSAVGEIYEEMKSIIVIEER